MASYNYDVANDVFANGLGNAQYISPKIQKQILFIFATRMRAVI